MADVVAIVVVERWPCSCKGADTGDTQWHPAPTESEPRSWQVQDAETDPSGKHEAACWYVWSHVAIAAERFLPDFNVMFPPVSFSNHFAHVCVNMLLIAIHACLYSPVAAEVDFPTELKLWVIMIFFLINCFSLISNSGLYNYIPIFVNERILYCISPNLNWKLRTVVTFVKLNFIIVSFVFFVFSY